MIVRSLVWPPAVRCLVGGALAALLISSGCRRASTEVSGQSARVAPVQFERIAIGEAPQGKPWISYLEVADLDQDGRLDVLVCDAHSDTIRWLHQVAPGKFVEQVLGDPVRAPAHVSPADVDGDGDLDLVVASMGRMLPTNDPIGAVVLLENDGAQRFRNRVLEEGIARVTDVRAADLDGDQDIDLVVGQFGYVQGEIRVLRKHGASFQSEPLLGLPGTIHTPVADFNGDGRLDIAAVVSQEWEEVHLFENTPAGFRDRTVWGSTNEDFGSSGLQLADLDRDGDTDLLYSNGDAFDYGRPGGRSWHGVQWLENRGGVFEYHRVGAFPGAFSPVAVDLDSDGDNDLVAVSGFNDWNDAEAVSIMAWINDGRQQFSPVVIARRPTHLMALAAGDLDGDGRIDLVTGGLHAYPPDGEVSRVTWWRNR